MPTELRVGLTMREVNASGYDEPRDALARAWGEFMQVALPEAVWMPLPNLGPDVAPRFCDRWGINALILTGGEDIGISAVRDETERALLRHFVRNGRPVLGVCRGLQLLWTEQGGGISAKAGHVAVRHRVRFIGEPALGIREGVHDVNSFHACSIGEHVATREPIVVFARAEDGSPEGVHLCNAPVAGVMWHPEREKVVAPADVSLVRHLFGLEERCAH